MRRAPPPRSHARRPWIGCSCRSRPPTAAHAYATRLEWHNLTCGFPSPLPSRLRNFDVCDGVCICDSTAARGAYTGFCDYCRTDGTGGRLAALCCNGFAIGFIPFGIQAQRFELAVQRGTADLQPPRHFRHLAPIVGNGVPNELCLQFFQRPHLACGVQKRQRIGRGRRLS